ncbi:MAG: hypothetical protein ABL949_04330 [Fimbriimonadaceae bacterium]
MKQLFVFLFVLPLLAHACINDRDTLAFEKRNVDALHRIESETNPRKKGEAIQELVLRAIGGRFERYPAKYYEMRIKRLLKKPSLTPPEFDDLAVAYDRIGKVDEAIKVILSSKSQRISNDHKYSFHANYGTFLVHRWIANGHTDKDIKTLRESIAEVKKALEINPKSHFGRENVQLTLEESWLPENHPVKYGHLHGKQADHAVVGAAGIIMMGLGYELPDVYQVIASARITSQASHSLMQEYAQDRIQELLVQGKAFVVEPERSETKKPSLGYLDLIADGEKVHQARQSYMNERFARGEHPDTHSDFWSGWKEPDFPVLKRIGDPFVRKLYFQIGLTFGGLLFLAIGGLILRDRIRKKRAL